MSRLIRVTAAAALAAAVFAPAAAGAAPPCDVTIEEGKIGGTNWTATVVYPKVTCS